MNPEAKLNIYIAISYNIFSEVFEISFGVRQGSIISPISFALYIDDIGKSCFINCGHDIILYADDIILIAPSVTELKKCYICVKMNCVT